MRISHSAVVDAWRERERHLRALGADVMLLSARRWNEAGAVLPLVPRDGEPVVGLRTFGTHPALFVYDPIALWRHLAEEWDVLDIHEEAYALCTAEVLALRSIRRLLPGRPKSVVPYVLYSGQNIAKRFPWPFSWFERMALRGAAGVSVCNIEAGQIARDKGLSGYVELIPLGVDPNMFAPSTGSAVADDKRIRVGYAGRLTPQKGVDVLIEAARQDDRIWLDLAGDGPLADRLRAEAAGLGDRVKFRGMVAGRDLPAFYRRLDVLAVPSLNTPGLVEQFGRVAVEAMACGTPVVASDSGALREVVGGAGVLVPPGDPIALGRAIVQVVDHPGLAAELRAAGLARAGECSWRSIAKRYLALYEKVVGDRRSVRAGTVLDDDLARSVGCVANRGGAAGRPPEVVVVAYGAPALLERALCPLVGQFQITVVDNSSSEEVRQVAQRHGAVYHDPGRNGGFAAGVNYALARRQVPGADVLLLNPDAVIEATGVRRLQAVLHADPRTASVAPAQIDATGAPVTVAWPFPTPLGCWLEALGLHRIWPVDDGAFLIGSVLLVRTDALADVGRFDESFFLYAEETDWAYRAHRRGWRHVLVPEVTAVHDGAATSSDTRRRNQHFYASQERYFRKHFGRIGWQVGRAGSAVGSALRASLRGGSGRRAQVERLHLYLRGPIRVEGCAGVGSGGN